MINEHERLADDACEEAHRAVDTVAAALKVAEAAELESFELGIYVTKLRRANQKENCKCRCVCILYKGEGEYCTTKTIFTYRSRRTESTMLEREH